MPGGVLLLPGIVAFPITMALHFLDENLWFPPVTEALEDGLLALGGDLSTERLLLAYRSGIFPWFNEEDPPLWWSPDPRFVLFPGEIKISKSMKQILKSGKFQFTTNTAFQEVITHCKNTYRPGQGGTWITDEIVESYRTLHERGYVHSAEAWLDGQLVGGLYGVRLGNVFFGESMFSHKSNASKFAFLQLVALLHTNGVELIDCQVYTPHLESLGARMIARTDFIKMIDEFAV